MHTHKRMHREREANGTFGFSVGSLLRLTLEMFFSVCALARIPCACVDLVVVFYADRLILAVARARARINTLQSRKEESASRARTHTNNYGASLTMTSIVTSMVVDVASRLSPIRFNSCFFFVCFCEFHRLFSYF